MAQVFDKAIITNEGFKLLSKAQAGQCKIIFTKIATGDGIYSSDEKANLIFQTTLKNQKNSYSVRSEVGTDNNVRINALITNRDPESKETLIRTGYYINEMGLFAKEDTEGCQEILYSIVLTAGEVGDFIPAYTSGAPAQINQSWVVAVGNAEIVNIAINPYDFATKEELEKKQDKLKAGKNITIENNVISAELPEIPEIPKFTQGIGISISSEHEISLRAQFSTSDIAVGSELESGKLYFVYEA